MPIRFKAFVKGMAVFVGAPLLAGCASESPISMPSTWPSVLNPQGPFAASIAGLASFIFILGALVSFVYIALVVVASWRRRNNPPPLTPGPSSPNSVITVVGILIPAIILVVSFGYTVNAMNAVPYSVPGAYIVEVVGHQWWWEVRYPDAQVTTANEIHIPAGRPVEIRGTSVDVIHSLWIPQLNGKMDFFPDRQTTMIIQASRPGTYGGECATFCGIQHAHMELLVIADSPDQFGKWIAAQQVVPPAPIDPHLRQGQQAFLGSACVYCHTIRGTNATGTVGPDLTHFASRLTIGAGMVANTRGNLAGWVVNPQGIKPGNLMPPIGLDSDQLQALLDYLASLK